MLLDIFKIRFQASETLSHMINKLVRRNEDSNGKITIAILNDIRSKISSNSERFYIIYNFG